MLWFKKTPVTTHTPMDNNHSIEIVAHKDANKQIAEQAKQATDYLNNLFEENGFTVKIVLAMGAKQQRGTKSHGH